MRHDDNTTEEAAERLIHEPNEDQDHDHDQNEPWTPARSSTDSNLEPVQSSVRHAGKIVRFLTLSAGISGLLFGFDTGVISSTLVSIGTDLSNRPLTTPDKSVVTAVTSLLALFSAPTTGYFADAYGRRSVIFVPAVLFIVGAILQAVAGYVWIMVIGRALVGAAVGVASGAVPLYITELAPAELRGRLVTIQSLFITGGQVVAYLIGWIFATLPHGWRFMVGLGAVPAAVQSVLLVWMPETPRWLLQKGRSEQAREVLLQVYSNLPNDQREAMVDTILQTVTDEISAADKTGSLNDQGKSGRGLRATIHHLTNEPGNRRALTIACMLQSLQQLCGFNALMYFSATIFAAVGFTSPITTSLSVAVTNFVFTLLAFAYIDTVGRRNILLRSIPFMVVGLFLTSLSFWFIGNTAALSSDIYSPIHSRWSMVLLLSMMVYVSAYAVGLGCVPWQQSELFPLRVRSLGSGFATSANWTSNFIVGMTFLPMMNVIGSSTTFGLYALVCIAGWVCIWRIYPETAGLPIESVGGLLQSGWGVSESVNLFKARKPAR